MASRPSSGHINPQPDHPEHASRAQIAALLCPGSSPIVGPHSILVLIDRKRSEENRNEDSSFSSVHPIRE